MPSPQQLLLVKQRGDFWEAKPYISHYPIIIPHNFPHVGISSLGKREKWVRQAIVCITPSFRGEKVDKSEGVGDEERGGKEGQKCGMIQRGIIDILLSGLWEKWYGE